jgi:hypothetical protein
VGDDCKSPVSVAQSSADEATQRPNEQDLDPLGAIPSQEERLELRCWRTLTWGPRKETDHLHGQAHPCGGAEISRND